MRKKPALLFCFLLIFVSLLSACSGQKSKVLEGSRVQDISGNFERTLIITDKNELWASGITPKGELGLVKASLPGGSDQGQGGCLFLPHRLAKGVGQAVTLADTTAYLTNKGELWLMGSHKQLQHFPQIGDSASYQIREYAQPTKVMQDVRKITAGADYFLILKEDGQLLIFGSKEIKEASPGLPEALRIVDQGVADVFAGDYTYFYLKDEELYSAGNNAWGERGQGEWGMFSSEGGFTIAHSYQPQLLASPVEDVKSVYSALYRTFLLSSSGDLFMLGKNLSDVYKTGKLNSAEPVLIAKDVDKVGFASLSKGEVVLVLKDGRLYGSGQGVDSLTSSLAPDAESPGWQEILADVEDFWTTPYLFIKTGDGQMRALANPASLEQAYLKNYGGSPPKDAELGQLAGWAWE